MGWPNHKFSCDVVVIFMLLFVLSMSKASIDIRLKQDNDINHQKTVQNQHWQQPLKQSQLPLVINTWNMSKATHAGEIYLVCLKCNNYKLIVDKV